MFKKMEMRLGALIQFSLTLLSVHGEAHHGMSFAKFIFPQSQTFHRQTFPEVNEHQGVVHRTSTGFHQQTIVYPKYSVVYEAPYPPYSNSAESDEELRYRYQNRPYNPMFTLLSPLGMPTPSNSAASLTRPVDSGPTFFGNKNSISNSRASNMPKSCSYFSEKGQCYTSSQCRSKAGRPTVYCANFSFFCCTVKYSCGKLSDDRNVYFRSPDYPFPSTLTSGCGLTIQKASNEVCYVRIKPLYMDLSSSVGFCGEIFLGIAGIDGKKYEHLCGSLTETSFDIDVRSVNKFLLYVNTDRRIRTVWNVLVSQIPCNEGYEKMWPEVGEFGTERPTPPTTTMKTTTSTKFPSSPAPPPFSTESPTITTTSAPAIKSQCGVEYKKKKTPKSRIQLDFVPTDFLGASQVANSDNIVFDVNKNPLLTSLDWTVPNVSESLLGWVAGVSPNAHTGRVTYGDKTSPHQYPWAVAMFRNGRFHCGASLISNKHVLTAAHCVVRYRNKPSALKLTLGDWDISTQTDGPNKQALVAKITTHPGYSSFTLRNDVAVITLVKAIKFSDTLLPVCLPPSNLKIEGKHVTVMGWGRNENNKLQSILMKHTAAVISNGECNNRWKKRGSVNIAESMLCMDSQTGDSCKGDSGGPSVMEYPARSGKFVQIGIVSFGSASCTDARLPGVYTNVRSFRTWITSQIA